MLRSAVSDYIDRNMEGRGCVSALSRNQDPNSDIAGPRDDLAENQARHLPVCFLVEENLHDQTSTASSQPNS